MPQVCSICSHSQRPEIDRALVAGAVLRNVAKQHGLTVWSVKRHRDAHLAESLVKGEEARREVQAFDVVRQLRLINAASLEVLKQARDARDGELALKAVDRVHKQIELQARLLNQLPAEGGVTVLQDNAQWVTIKESIVLALRPYPDALRALQAALSEAKRDG